MQSIGKKSNVADDVTKSFGVISYNNQRLVSQLMNSKGPKD